MLFALLCAVCAAFAGDTPNPNPQLPPSDKDLIFFYRTQSLALVGRAAVFYLDDKRVVDLLQSDYTYLYVAGGHHAIRLIWQTLPNDASSFPPTDYSIDLEPGHVYFFQLRTTSNEDSGSSRGQPGVVGWKLDGVAGTRALADLQSLNFRSVEPAFATTP